MDPIEFRIEMSLAGCIQLFHPALRNSYWVLEQKLNSDHGFLPLEQGVYVFRIIDKEPYAFKTELDTLEEIFHFLEKKIDREGWKIMDIETAIDIPKKNFVKWQLCHRVF
jgi:hypothetical protein